MKQSLGAKGGTEGIRQGGPGEGGDETTMKQSLRTGLEGREGGLEMGKKLIMVSAYISHPVPHATF